MPKQPLPLRVTVKLRNNRILRKLEALGLSVGDASEAIGLSRGGLYDVVALKRGPTHKRTGKLNSWVMPLCRLLDASPVELWPPELLGVPEPVVSFESDAASLRLLPSAPPLQLEMERTEAADLLREVLTVSRLTARERYVLLALGVDGSTLEEVGAELGLGRERVRMIQAMALRKCRLHGQGASEDPLSRRDRIAARERRMGRSSRARFIGALSIEAFTRWERGGND